MEGQAIPVDELVEIDIEIELDAAIVARSGVQAAARVAPKFADIVDAKLHPVLRELQAQAAERSDGTEQRGD